MTIEAALFVGMVVCVLGGFGAVLGYCLRLSSEVERAKSGSAGGSRS